VALLFVVVVGAAVDLVRIARDLDRGRAAISGLNLDTLGDGLVPTVDSAAGRLHHAHEIAHGSPFLSAIGVVPGIKTQVDAVRDLTDVGDSLGQTGVGAAHSIDKVLQQAGGDASKRVVLLDTVLQQLDVVDDAVQDLHVGADGPLLLPLAHVRQKVVDELEGAPARLEQARFYVGGLRRVLAGPSRYLLLAANNAEMRGGAGSPLTGGVVTIQDGDIEFGEFRQLVGIHIPRPEAARAPASWNQTYAAWAWGKSYLETSASPNFAVTGGIYQAMAPDAGFGQVDGVLEVDVVSLAYLLSAIGPVQLDGVTYDQANVAQKILNENYLTFSDTTADRGDRVQLQSALAKEIFEAFKSRDVPITKLALALQQAAVGRHLLAHSSDPAVQELWESIGADGSLNPLGLMVAVENVAANKLDWYIDPKVSINAVPAGDGSWAVRLTVSITNPEVKKTSQQIDGGYYGLEPGDHRAMVAVYFPQAAYNVRTADNTYSEGGPDPPLYMAAQRPVIHRGETVRVIYEFSMPKELPGVVILPAGRVRPTEYTINGGPAVTDAAPGPVVWLEPDDGTPGAPAIAGVLALVGALAVVGGLHTRLRYSRRRPIRPTPELALQAPTLGVVLFVAAAGVLVAGWLISGFGH
jgi:hypothetical protein